MGNPIEKKRANGPFGSKGVELFDAPRAKVGPFSLNTENPVFLLDLSELRRVTGKNIKGIIGMDFIRFFVWDMDFDNHKLELRYPNEFDSFRSDASLFMMSGEGNLPYIFASACSHTSPFVIDTGNTGTAGFNTNLFEQLVRLKKISPGAAKLNASLTGRSHSLHGRTSCLEVGPFRHDALDVKAGAQQPWFGLLV